MNRLGVRESNPNQIRFSPIYKRAQATIFEITNLVAVLMVTGERSRRRSSFQNPSTLGADIRLSTPPLASEILLYSQNANAITVGSCKSEFPAEEG